MFERNAIGSCPPLSFFIMHDNLVDTLERIIILLNHLWMLKSTNVHRGSHTCLASRVNQLFTIPYLLIMSFAIVKSSHEWNLAWKWPRPQRTRTFLWMALHHKLLTNIVRFHGHMSSSIICHKHLMRTLTIYFDIAT